MNILILEPADFPVSALQRLREFGQVYLGSMPPSAGSAHAVFIRLSRFIGESFYREHPELRYVVSPTTGLNHIDCSFFETVGVKVLSLKGQTAFLDNIRATAEHTLALTLALIRKIPQAAASVEQRAWNRYPFRGSELHGKQVFLVGYGRLGRQVARLFNAFGCVVRAYDIVPGRVPPEMALPLEQGLASADIVSLHVNLDGDSAGFFNAKLLSCLKNGAVFINTARGELVDQRALLERLASGRIGAAALDVLVDEPAPVADDVLAALSASNGRLLITPHIGGFTTESLEAVEYFVTEMLISALREA